jgi:ComF family protein
VTWLKFKGVRAVAPILSLLLVPRLPLIGALADLQAHALFIPIPLHPHRERERGFNQSALIAQHLSGLTRIPWLNMLSRRRATRTQSQLPTEMRGENLREAFELLAAIPLGPERRIAIIVDDVTTSGATLTAAAAALSPLPWRQIWGLTVARG